MAGTTVTPAARPPEYRALVCVTTCRRLHHLRRYLPHFEDPLLGATLFSAVAASLTNSFFESWLFGFGSAATVPLWLFLALLSYQTDVVRQRILRWRHHQARLRLAPAMGSQKR